MISYVHEWSAQANCFGRDTKDFFDAYEASVDGDQHFAHEMDKLCTTCPCQQDCLAFAATHKEWGLWGGVYFEDGKISKQFNKHKSNDDWFEVWMNATMES